MGHMVGMKGQVVIEKGIRERLGVGPGWEAVQTLVDDHVEIRFVPPEHDQSAFGMLAPYVQRDAAQDEMDHAIGQGLARDYRRSLEE